MFSCHAGRSPGLLRAMSPGPALLGALVAAAIAVAATATQAVAAPVTLTFSATGAEQSFTVPDATTSIDVVAIGGQGGSATGDGRTRPGGFGSRVAATLTGLTPGSVLYLGVGGNGENATCGAGGAGGFNGGGPTGAGVCRGGGGGGATDVRTCSRSDGGCSTLGSRLLVAGGGGGGGGTGNASNAASGAGGAAGLPGDDVAGDCRGTIGGGGAGTATAGGAGGANGNVNTLGTAGIAGTLGAGGAGGNGNGGGFTAGGGGGGGLYGGGGGGSSGFCAGGGGGGSDLLPAGATRSLDTAGMPKITLTLEGGPPAAVTSPTLAPASIVANGTAQSTARVTVRDANGVPLPGLTVVFTSSDAGQQVGATTEEGNGVYSATVTASTTTGAATITATVSGGGPSGQATLTQTLAPATTVTAPVAGTGFVQDTRSPGTFAASGTANAAVSAVDLACQTGTSSFQRLGGAGQNVPVVDGAWSQPAVPLPISVGSPNPCRLLAVPAGENPTNLSFFDGPRIRMLALEVYTLPSGGIADYYAFAGGTAGAAELLGVGSCGLGGSHLLLSAPTVSRGAFSCNGYFSGAADPFDANAPALVVDGHPSYTNPVARTVFTGADADPALPGLTVTPRMAADGTFVLTERAPVVRCSAGTAPDQFPVTTGSCTAFTGAGVELEVVYRISLDGRTVRQTQFLRSTDGQAHTVSLAQQQSFTNGSQQRLPGETGYVARSPGDVAPALPPGAGTISNLPPPRLPARGPASITYSSRPDAVVFLGSSFVLRYTARTVPATGRSALAFVYTNESDAGVLEAAAAANEASLPPTLAVATPADGATTTSETATVSGTVSYADELADLTVNGARVAVAADGSWTADVPLAVGSNAITVRAGNVLGYEREVTRSVVRSLPAPAPAAPARPGSPTPPVRPPAGPLPADGADGAAGSVGLGAAGRPLARRVGSTFEIAPGISAGCPQGGLACTVRMRATLVRSARAAARRTRAATRTAVAGRRALALRPGVTRALTFRLSSRAARHLRRTGRIRLRVAVVLWVGDRPADRSVRIIAVRSPRRGS